MSSGGVVSFYYFVALWGLICPLFCVFWGVFLGDFRFFLTFRRIGDFLRLYFLFFGGVLVVFLVVFFFNRNFLSMFALFIH